MAAGGLLQEMEKRAHSVLTPSGYSASSVYQDHEDSMAHRAHLDVFNSQDETPRAWCPARPVQDGLTEWLQIEFDSLKLVKMLITRGRGPNTGEFVPAFYMKYQRDNGDWYDYVSGTGQRTFCSTLQQASQLVQPCLARLWFPPGAVFAGTPPCRQLAPTHPSLSPDGCLCMSLASRACSRLLSSYTLMLVLRASLQLAEHTFTAI
nr:unnamed protein product [Spirometra erinaceieuropaei]